MGNPTTTCDKAELCLKCLAKIYDAMDNARYMHDLYRRAGSDSRNRTSTDVENAVKAMARADGGELTTQAYTTAQGKVVNLHKQKGPCSGLLDSFTNEHEAVHKEMQRSLEEQYGADTKEFLDQWGSAINWATDEMAAYSREMYLYQKFIDQCAAMGIRATRPLPPAARDAVTNPER
jgi:hypothetical protein